MNFTEKPIEEYCRDHSSNPSSVCEEIFQYTQKNVEMAVMMTGPHEGSFLGFLIKLINAKRILEIGTFTGYSALAMAEQLPDSGELVTLDLNSQTTELAQTFWNKSPHGKKIKAQNGEASELLENLKGPFDLIFIDADKRNYLSYVQKALTLLSKGGAIAVDNTLWSGRVLEKNATDPDTCGIQSMNDWVKENKSLQKVLVPIRDGILLIRSL